MGCTQMGLGDIFLKIIVIRPKSVFAGKVFVVFVPSHVPFGYVSIKITKKNIRIFASLIYSHGP